METTKGLNENDSTLTLKNPWFFISLALSLCVIILIILLLLKNRKESTWAINYDVLVP